LVVELLMASLACFHCISIHTPEFLSQGTSVILCGVKLQLLASNICIVLLVIQAVSPTNDFVVVTDVLLQTYPSQKERCKRRQELIVACLYNN